MTSTGLLGFTGTRPFWLKTLIDQSAHFLAAMGTVGLLLALGSTIPPLAGLLAGFALGVVREITEGGNVVSDGSITDMAFWALGGCVGAILGW